MMKIAYSIRREIQNEFRISLYIKRIQKLRFKDKIRIVFNIFLIKEN